MLHLSARTRSDVWLQTAYEGTKQHCCRPPCVGCKTATAHQSMSCRTRAPPRRARCTRQLHLRPHTRSHVQTGDGNGAHLHSTSRRRYRRFRRRRRFRRLHRRRAACGDRPHRRHGRRRCWSRGTGPARSTRRRRATCHLRGGVLAHVSSVIAHKTPCASCKPAGGRGFRRSELPVAVVQERQRSNRRSSLQWRELASNGPVTALGTARTEEPFLHIELGTALQPRNDPPLGLDQTDIGAAVPATSILDCLLWEFSTPRTGAQRGGAGMVGAQAEARAKRAEPAQQLMGRIHSERDCAGVVPPV